VGGARRAGDPAAPGRCGFLPSPGPGCQPNLAARGARLGYIAAMARGHVLERSQLVPAARAEVFAFFADAFNLEAITPQFLRFRVTTPAPIPMAPGALIDYRLSLYGVGFRWRTRIEVWEPGVRFVDVQLSGPYRLWRHTHTFEDAPGGRPAPPPIP
jgi:hypothetical protein